MANKKKVERLGSMCSSLDSRPQRERPGIEAICVGAIQMPV